jgi:magnesium transporter
MAFFTKRYHPPGTPAGTLSWAEAEPAPPVCIHLIDYSPEGVLIREDVTVSACRDFLDRPSITWIHVEGHPDEGALQEWADQFGLHKLALEDVLNTGQRPKVETFDDHLFAVMSLPLMEANVVEVQQLSLFLSGNMLLSFHDGDFSLFAPIIKRLQDKSSRLRARGVDYLFYSVLDLVIDQGFPLLESFGTQLERLEDEILRGPGRKTLENIHVVRRELTLLRRMLWPHREVINQLLREESELISEGTGLYLRDCYDHTIQVMDLLETYREMTTGMLDIYLSGASNRMNDIMRVLTVIATIFIPLTFITGIYGMNFDTGASRWNMPELGSPFGYAMVWLVMIGVAGAMISWFRSKNWL